MAGSSQLSRWRQFKHWRHFPRSRTTERHVEVDGQSMISIPQKVHVEAISASWKKKLVPKKRHLFFFFPLVSSSGRGRSCGAAQIGSGLPAGAGAFGGLEPSAGKRSQQHGCAGSRRLGGLDGRLVGPKIWRGARRLFCSVFLLSSTGKRVVFVVVSSWRLTLLSPQTTYWIFFCQQHHLSRVVSGFGFSTASLLPKTPDVSARTPTWWCWWTTCATPPCRMRRRMRPWAWFCCWTVWMRPPPGTKIGEGWVFG